MSVYRRARGIYWYSFSVGGSRFQKSTETPDLRQARKIEANEKLRLKEAFRQRREKARELECKPEDLAQCFYCQKAFSRAIAVTAYRHQFCSETCSEHWTEQNKQVPTLREFSQRFLDNAAVGRRRAPRESTVAFYADCLNQLCSYRDLAEARLDRIGPELIERYLKAKQSKLSMARLNGLLRTLRRLLHVAQDLDIIKAVPRIPLRDGEREREFVLSAAQETPYLENSPQPLRDLSVLLVDTGLRLGEACHLEWRDVRLQSAIGARHGFILVRGGKTRNARRTVLLTRRASEMLNERQGGSKTIWVFSSEDGQGPLSRHTVSNQHRTVRRLLRMPEEFVIHSLRHTMLTRLGAAGADAFTIKKLAGHSSILISQKYVHPTPETIELHFQRFEDKATKQLTEGHVKAKVTTISLRSKKRKKRLSA
jgi:integrase